MTIDIIKHIEIELTDEEKNTLIQTRKILHDLMSAMQENKCQWIECVEDYGESLTYNVNTIDDIDTVIDNLCNITEIY